MTDQKYLQASAILGGPNKEYRYWLERQWGTLAAPVRTIGFIGYNPSTADATQDDHTIIKEVGFAKQWGYSRLVKGNIYAYRSTDWRGLQRTEDPFGPDNHIWLTKVFQQSEIVVCAWGAMPLMEDYAKSLSTWALGQPTSRCLGKNKGGSPRHPLMLGYDVALEEI